MNLDQAAAASGVTKRTLYNWITCGYLPFTQVGDTRQVQLADLLIIKRRYYRKRRAKRTQRLASWPDPRHLRQVLRSVTALQRSHA